MVFPIRNNGSLNINISYQLTPVYSDVSAYTFEQETQAKMIETYKQYDYVWFVRFTKKLFQKNQRLLAPKGKSIYTLYKVIVTNDTLTLKPMK